MGRIYEDGRSIYQMKLHTFFKDMGKDLFEQARIFKTPGIVFPKSRKMRNLVQHVQPQEPAISYVYFDFLYSLSHASDSIKILNKGNFDQHYRIHARSSVIGAILVFHKIINEVPIDCTIDLSKHVIFRHHVIHTEHHHLFSFFIGIFCHHKRNLLMR